MRIQVKHKHILKGKPFDCFSCPVALAVLEALAESGGHVGNVRVQYDFIKAGGRLHHVPRSVIRFIDRFDNYKHAARPFAFNLRRLKK